jgi:hypothetical protein
MSTYFSGSSKVFSIIENVQSDSHHIDSVVVSMHFMIEPRQSWSCVNSRQQDTIEVKLSVANEINNTRLITRLGRTMIVEGARARKLLTYDRSCSCSCRPGTGGVCLFSQDLHASSA